MNLVFLYSSRGRVPIDKPHLFPNAKIPENYEQATPTNIHVNSTLSDLYPYVWENLLKHNVFDKITTIFETGDGWGTTYYKNDPRNKFVFIPHISEASKFIEPKDLIFVRGGWMWWRHFIRDLVRKQHYTMYFRGGRQIFKHWPWYLVIDDIYLENAVDKYNRANIYYPKCVNEEVFYYKPNTPLQYDIIIVGEIKESKGQWRTLNALRLYKQQYKENPKVLLIGRMTNGMRLKSILRRNDLDVTYKGSVSREELNEYYNASKLYIHLGSNEQGPRTTIEAIRCGTPCLISNLPGMWPEWQTQSSFVRTVNHRDAEAISRAIYEMLHTEHSRLAVARLYNQYANVKLTVKMWQAIVSVINKHPQPDKKVFINAFDIRKRR